MAGEYEPESTRERLAQLDSARQYQQAQYARIAAPTGYIEPMVPSVYAESAWEAKQRATDAQQAVVAQRPVASAGRLENNAHGDGGILGLGSIEAAQVRSAQATEAVHESERLWRESMGRVLPTLRGQALGASGAQQVRATGKTFTLETLLAVLRSRKAVLTGRPHFDEACRELDTLIDIFTRMEA